MVNLLKFVKNLLSVLRLRAFLVVIISCVLLPVHVGSCKMFKISIHPKLEGIYSRRSVHNGDEKVGHIYLSRVSLTVCYFRVTHVIENILILLHIACFLYCVTFRSCSICGFYCIENIEMHSLSVRLLN